jgi:BirA family biotin operon repressor/biotin-[acetyl-CoA-carboxylase] ligase
MKADAVEKKIVNRPILRYAVLDSTNTEAKKLAEAGAREGTVVIADQQCLGRGRLGRAWQSPAGKGLWFTLILRPKISPEFGAQVTLLMAVAVVDALKQVTGLITKIKWPNDILVDNKKLCGILSELTLTEEGIDYVIVGVGINVNLNREDFKEDLAERASSVFLQTGKNWNNDIVLDAILKSFEKRYDSWHKNGFSDIRAEWQSKNCTLGNVVSVKDNDQEIFCGTAVNIDDYGCLQVRSGDGITKKFDFGEISIRF